MTYSIGYMYCTYYYAVFILAMGIRHAPKKVASMCWRLKAKLYYRYLKMIYAHSVLRIVVYQMELETMMSTFE